MMMNGPWPRFCMAVAALALAVTSAAPQVRAAGSRSPSVTITVWTAYSRAQLAAFNELTSRFQAKYPNIKVDEVSSPNYTALLQKEQSAVFAGNTPTIAQGYEEWVQQFLRSNAVEPLDSYVRSKNGFSKKEIADFPKALWRDGFLGKHMYMMPFSKSDIVFYFDRAVMRQHGIKNPPQSWSEFGKDCKKLTDSGSNPSHWCMTFAIDASSWYAWEVEWGAKILDSHNKAAFGNNTGAAPVSFFAGLARKKEVVISTSANYQDQADFDAGKTAFCLGSSAGLPFFISGAKPGVTVGEAMFPAGPKRRATEIYGAPLFMFKNVPSAEKQAGWLLMKFLTQPASTAYWAIHSGYMPVRYSAFKLKVMRDFYRQNPQQRASVNQLKYGVFEPALIGWTKARTDIGSNLAAGLTGSKTPLSSMRTAADQVNNDLAQK